MEEWNSPVSKYSRLLSIQNGNSLPGYLLFDLFVAQWFVRKMKPFVLIISYVLLLAGCGQPDLDDSKVLNEILSKSIDTSDVQERDRAGETLAFVINFQNPFSGWASRMYDNGQVRELSKFEEGKREGLWVKWYENGRKEEEKNYRDGKLHGLATRWWENGKKWYEENYENGEKIGESKFYD